MGPNSVGQPVSQSALWQLEEQTTRAIDLASACLAVNECPDGYEGWTSTHRSLLPIGNVGRVRGKAWPSIPSQPILSAGVNRYRARKEA
jgi:hypothetical protein